MLAARAMQILHIYEIANVARTLADAQAALGHPARVMARPNPVLEPPDVLLPRTTNPVVSQIAILRHSREIREANVLHVHGGIWKSHLVWSYLRARFPRKALVVHLHGSEARTGRGLHHLRSADRLLASTPDLLRIVPEAEWQPVPVVLPSAVSPLPEGKPVIGHFPSDRAIKGTDSIVDGFLRLGPVQMSSPEPGVTRYEGAGATLLVVEGVPHRRALELMDACHLVVDQVNELGIYSLVSAEAMARGRVAVSSYDPTLYPEPLPIVITTRDEVRETLATLLGERGSWSERGARGREYVLRVHAPDAAAKKTIATYDSILATRHA